MLTNTNALVLRSMKYGDFQVIVDMLTRELGRVSFIERVPKTARGRVKKQFFQPLTQLDISFDFRSTMRLQHLKDVRMAYPWQSIPFDAYKTSITLFIAEFLFHATHGEQQNPLLFDYVVHSLQWLDGAATDFANFHLVFMMRLSRFIGFFPNLVDYREGCFFDLQSGEFTHRVPLHAYFLRPDEAARVGVLMRMNYESMHLFRLNRTERNRIASLILTYYQLHVPDFPVLKSFAVVQELFK